MFIKGNRIDYFLEYTTRQFSGSPQLSLNSLHRAGRSAFTYIEDNAYSTDTLYLAMSNEGSMSAGLPKTVDRLYVKRMFFVTLNQGQPENTIFDLHYRDQS